MLFKILIVEDSPTTRAMICAAIGAIDNVEILESRNGLEALKLIPRHTFHLIITDINMPDINGLELVSFVRENAQYKRVPIIILTTEGSDKDKEKGLALGANEYMVKPFNKDALQKIVRKYLVDQVGY